MKKIRVSLGAVLMTVAMLLSDSTEIFILYAISAGLHELGHLCAARCRGVGIKEIRFDFSGVRICTESGVSSYKDELLIAVSGPFVNFSVIILTVSVLSVMGVSLGEATEGCRDFLFNREYTHIGALSFVALSSLLQGAVNLLPVRTFDGGRIAHCIAAVLFSERAAERMLDVFSSFSAFVLWTAALYLMLKVSSGLGIYVFSVCLFLSTLNNAEDK